MRLKDTDDTQLPRRQRLLLMLHNRQHIYMSRWPSQVTWPRLCPYVRVPLCSPSLRLCCMLVRRGRDRHLHGQMFLPPESRPSQRSFFPNHCPPTIRKVQFANPWHTDFRPVCTLRRCVMVICFQSLVPVFWIKHEYLKTVYTIMWSHCRIGS